MNSQLNSTVGTGILLNGIVVKQDDQVPASLNNYNPSSPSCNCEADRTKKATCWKKTASTPLCVCKWTRVLGWRNEAWITKVLSLHKYFSLLYIERNSRWAGKMRWGLSIFCFISPAQRTTEWKGNHVLDWKDHAGMAKTWASVLQPD